MSSTKSKLDLLVRVRYQNPLPAPPYPPKLLNIPTNPARYATLDYTGDYANDVPFPMVVDAEMGMPLDLGRYECLWQDGGDPLELNPDPNNLPPIDPKDDFMLEGYSAQAGGSRQGSQSASGSQTLQFSWLRRTEYVTAKDDASRVQALARDEDDEVEVDISREAQIRDVESTFLPVNKKVDLASIRHPNHPNRRAVDSYDVLPDPETFATVFDVFRFAERPGDRPTEQEDPRLDSALLRPVRLDDGETFMAYYLTSDDDQAIQLKQQRNFALEMNAMTNEEPVPFDLIRDYDSKVVMDDQGNELLVVFDDGSLAPHSDAVGSTREAERRPKGVYYKVISRRHVAKRRRADPNDPAAGERNMTDAINLSYRALDETERLERANELEELMNPDYEPPEEEEEAPMISDRAADTRNDDDIDAEADDLDF